MSHIPGYLSEVESLLDVAITPNYTKRKLDEISVAGHLSVNALRQSPVYQIPWIKPVIDVLIVERKKHTEK